MVRYLSISLISLISPLFALNSNVSKSLYINSISSFATVPSNMPITELPDIDVEYPGTSVIRLRSIVERTRELTVTDLSDDW